jgi:hypothetical protein
MSALTRTAADYNALVINERRGDAAIGVGGVRFVADGERYCRRLICRNRIGPLRRLGGGWPNYAARLRL